MPSGAPSASLEKRGVLVAQRVKHPVSTASVNTRAATVAVQGIFLAQLLLDLAYLVVLLVLRFEWHQPDDKPGQSQPALGMHGARPGLCAALSGSFPALCGDATSHPQHGSTVPMQAPSRHLAASNAQEFFITSHFQDIPIFVLVLFALAGRCMFSLRHLPGLPAQPGMAAR